jgi:Tol biopolymer transport system component
VLLSSGAIAVALVSAGTSVGGFLGSLAFGPDANGPIAVVAPGPSSELGVDNLELYAVGPAEEGLRNLTQSSSAERDPAWSADGSRVAFFATSMKREPGGTYSFHDGVYVMRADGSDRREVLSCDKPRCPLQELAWSPDGTRIAFVRAISDDLENILLVMNADGSGLREVCDFEKCGVGVAEPAWSPDGTMLAFSNRDAALAHGPGRLPSAIFVAQMDGDAVTRLTNRRCVLGTEPRIDCEFDAGPAWSPDGTTITFGYVDLSETDTRPGSRLHAIRVDGSGRREVAACDGESCAGIVGKWSPDGSSIAFISRFEPPTVTLISPEGDQIGKFRTCITRRCVGPSSLTWSPEGDQLAFVGHDHSVYAIGADGTGMRTVTSSVDGCCLAWLPRAARRIIPPPHRGATIPNPAPIGPPTHLPGLVAFASDRTSPHNEDHYEIYTMRSDGSELVRLSGPSDYNFHPTWSPDGGQIAFGGWDNTAQQQGIFVVNADGSRVRQLTDFKSPAHQPDWSPDGSLIACVAPAKDVGPEIYVIRPDGTGLRRITTLGGVSEPDWSPDGSTILFSASGPEGENLHTVDVATGKINRLTDLPGGAQFPAWSPDGSVIAFDWWTPAGAGLYLVNPDGTGLRRAAGAGHRGDPSWLPDGSRILLGGLDNDSLSFVYALDIDGTGSSKLPNHGGNTRDAAWQPTGPATG